MTHLDQLADKLREERVRRVVEPLLSGGDGRAFTDRDLEYVRDLGLVAQEPPVRIANPLYAEVVPRELTWIVQEELAQDVAWYVDADGVLDLDKLLASFQAFFREHSEHWVARFDYVEAGPQGLERTIREGIAQTAGYMDRCAARSGHLVIFDRTEGKPWPQKTFRRDEHADDGRAITVWGM